MHTYTHTNTHTLITQATKILVNILKKTENRLSYKNYKNSHFIASKVLVTIYN